MYLEYKISPICLTFILLFYFIFANLLCSVSFFYFIDLRLSRKTPVSCMSSICLNSVSTSASLSLAYSSTLSLSPIISILHTHTLSPLLPPPTLTLSIDGLLMISDLAPNSDVLSGELERLFIYSLTWAVGGLLDVDDRYVQYSTVRTLLMSLIVSIPYEHH